MPPVKKRFIIKKINMSPFMPSPTTLVTSEKTCDLTKIMIFGYLLILGNMQEWDLQGSGGGVAGEVQFQFKFGGGL